MCPELHFCNSCMAWRLQAAVGGASGEGTPPGEGIEGPLEELQGFDFARLAERRPELKQELLGFRDHLLASSSSEESLKVISEKKLLAMQPAMADTCRSLFNPASQNNT